MLDIMPELRSQKTIEHPNLGIEVSGEFTCWITRPKSGSMIRKPWKIKNGATTLGLNYVLNTAFRNQSQLTAWYAGIISGAGFSGVSINDTPSSHTGWTEFIGFSESVRQTWSPGAAAAGVIVNTTAMAFTINSSGSGQGVFLISDSAKSGTVGTLWATAVEASSFSLTAGVVFNAIYQVTFTPVS